MAYRQVEAHPVVVSQWWAGARERGSDGARPWWDRCKHECLDGNWSAARNGREPGVPTECTDDPNSWPCPLTRPSDPDLVRMTVDQPASGAGVGGHMLSLTRYLSTRETDMTSWQETLWFLLIGSRTRLVEECVWSDWIVIWLNCYHYKENSQRYCMLTGIEKNSSPYN